jgi:hypothetical protein
MSCSSKLIKDKRHLKKQLRNYSIDLSNVRNAISEVLKVSFQIIGPKIAISV